MLSALTPSVSLMQDKKEKEKEKEKAKDAARQAHDARHGHSQSSTSTSSASSSHNTLKKARPTSMFMPKSRPVSPGYPLADAASNGSHGDQPLEMTRTRPKINQKNRNSMFGSFKSLPLSEEENRITPSVSKTPSIDEEEDMPHSIVKEGIRLGSTVLQRGEVQTSGGMFRKRNHYMVLTDTHLVKFKSQSKAAEMFPSIPTALARSATSRASLTASVTSLHELQIAAYADITSGISLNQIIAVCRLDDGRPYFSIEISYLDERSRRQASMHMQLNDPREADSWLAAIRTAARKARANDPIPFEQATVDYVARSLHNEQDYDPDHFHMFKAVQRSSNKNSRSSTDDLSKLSSTICYLAIGQRKIHLVPVRFFPNRLSTTSLNDVENVLSFGIMTLTSFSMQTVDDSLRLTFRVPLKNAFTIQLGSAFAAEIALWIRHAAEYLRPRWLHQPFDFNIPPSLDDESIIIQEPEEDHGSFDRTLTAYCAGYDLDASMFRYTIDYECEDAPCFRLLPPASSRRTKYTNLELLAVMRALRYNESFVSISFANISLDGLHKVRDSPKADGDALRTRSGLGMHIENEDRLSLLSSEMRALAAKSKRLRRFDFTSCLERRPSTDPEIRDVGCGLPEAILPLCRRQITNVDWIILNGITLSETDMDYLVDAAVQRQCHLRALEVSNCGLSVHDLDLILSAMKAQENTLEVINISGVQGRLSPELFQQQIGYFGQIRRINLERISRTSGPESLIAPETLLTWRLESLCLSSTAVNEQTVDSISAYLASDRSSTLRELRLNQCGLTGRDVAVFLQSQHRDHGGPRPLHIHISENRLDTGYSSLFEAIAASKTPTHMSMRMIDFKKEDHFRQLIIALQKNRSLRYLDISKASLPYDAGQETCQELQRMFEMNDTLEELDISGEYAHLDVTRFGIGLNLALTGLKKNTSLRVLKIEHQKLGLQGANTLATVLEANSTLTEIYCENNDINLQSFTVLLNGLQKNENVLFLPSMDRDRELSLDKVRREIEEINKMTAGDGGHHHGHGHSHNSNSYTSTTSSIRRSFTASFSSSKDKQKSKPSKLGIGSRPTTPSAAAAVTVTQRHSSAPAYTPQDVAAVLRSLNEKWDAELERLVRYLDRNAYIASGIYNTTTTPSSSSDVNAVPDLSSTSAVTGVVPAASALRQDSSFSSESDPSRPGTANSLSAYLDASRTDRTPTLERSLDFSRSSGAGSSLGFDGASGSSVISEGSVSSGYFNSATTTTSGLGPSITTTAAAGYVGMPMMPSHSHYHHGHRRSDSLGNIFEESFVDEGGDSFDIRDTLGVGMGLGKY